MTSPTTADVLRGLQATRAADEAARFAALLKVRL